MNQAAGPIPPKAKVELIEKIQETMSKMGFHMMIIGMSPIMMRDLKEENPEAYYTFKAKLKDFRNQMDETVKDIDKNLAEMT